MINQRCAGADDRTNPRINGVAVGNIRAVGTSSYWIEERDVRVVSKEETWRGVEGDTTGAVKDNDFEIPTNRRAGRLVLEADESRELGFGDEKRKSTGHLVRGDSVCRMKKRLTYS